MSIPSFPFIYAYKNFTAFYFLTSMTTVLLPPLIYLLPTSTDLITRKGKNISMPNYDGFDGGRGNFLPIVPSMGLCFGFVLNTMMIIKIFFIFLLLRGIYMEPRPYKLFVQPS